MKALSSLEAVAGFLAKRGGGVPRLLVTVSEGFFATARALSRLLGYSVGFMLVEPMDLEAFKRLYGEYRRLYGCRVGFEVFTALVGPLPGYLTKLCERDESLLAEWLQGEARKVYATLHAIAGEASLSFREARERALRLLEGEPAEAPLDVRVEEMLVEHNIAYPCPSQPQVYKPQLPVYTALLEMVEALEGRVGAGRVLEAVVEAPRAVAGCPQ
ncbi:MAG: hypothetical protein F7B17_01695 [Desulfurococcales archaeon]|nr:hypothetical protein [Desulfurococcales archaeon]